jgi:hypothetical protein
MKRVSVPSCLAAEIQSKLRDTFISHTKNHKPSYLSNFSSTIFRCAVPWMAIPGAEDYMGV